MDNQPDVSPNPNPAAPAPAPGDQPAVAPSPAPGTPAVVPSDPASPAAAPVANDPLSQVPPQTLAKSSRRVMPMLVAGMVILLLLAVVFAVLL